MHFRPEFINRIDETLIFHALGKAEILKIADIQLKNIASRIAEQNIQLEITDNAKEFISEAGFDADFGARPLKRAIIKLVETPISRLIIAGNVLPNSKLIVDVKDEQLSFECVKFESES